MYCECGCEEKTTIAKQTRTKKGHIRGKPVRFIPGHGPQPVQHKGSYNPKGALHPNWIGGRSQHMHGYLMKRKRKHPKATGKGQYVFEHLILAEKALGKHLPQNAVVFHLDENKSGLDNLVICQNNGYAQVLRRRRRALQECGDASKRRCPFCKEYDDEINMYMRPSGQCVHRECANKYLREWKAEKKSLERKVYPCH